MKILCQSLTAIGIILLSCWVKSEKILKISYNLLFDLEERFLSNLSYKRIPGLHARLYQSSKSSSFFIDNTFLECSLKRRKFKRNNGKNISTIHSCLIFKITKSNRFFFFAEFSLNINFNFNYFRPIMIKILIAPLILTMKSSIYNFLAVSTQK